MKIMYPPGYHHNGYLATCTWAHDLQLHTGGINESKSTQQREETLFS